MRPTPRGHKRPAYDRDFHGPGDCCIAVGSPYNLGAGPGEAVEGVVARAAG